MDKIENKKLVKKVCPYCDMAFEIDKKGLSDKFLDHLFNYHYNEIVVDFNVFDLTMKDNLEDIIDSYMNEIKGMLLDNYEDDIVDDWGEDYVDGIIEELVLDATVIDKEE